MPLIKMRGLLKLGVGPVWGCPPSHPPGTQGPRSCSPTPYPVAYPAVASGNCKSCLSVSVVVKASAVSFLDHEGQKQNKKNHKKKFTKQKTK